MMTVKVHAVESKSVRSAGCLLSVCNQAPAAHLRSRDSTDASGRGERKKSSPLGTLDLTCQFEHGNTARRHRCGKRGRKYLTPPMSLSNNQICIDDWDHKNELLELRFPQGGEHTEDNAIDSVLSTFQNSAAHPR